MNWKRVVPTQRMKRNRTGTSSRSVELGLSTVERHPLLMEESQEQGLMGAGRTMRQGTRSRRLILGERASHADPNPEGVRRDRRGATQ